MGVLRGVVDRIWLGCAKLVFDIDTDSGNELTCPENGGIILFSSVSLRDFS